jgi:TonB family protein
MKSILKISLFALAVVLTQACGTKSKENADETATVPELTAEEKAAQEKKEAQQKREAAQQERLRIAAERRASAEAFYKEPTGDVIYNKAEVAPSYPGSKDAMTKYFQDNLKYPKEAQTKGWDGTIYVDFVVGKTGKVRAVTITDETDPDVDQSLKDEAIRVVSSMPAWVPGRQKGKAVAVKFNLPVAFKLE